MRPFRAPLAAALAATLPACVGPAGPAADPQLRQGVNMAQAATPPPALEPTDTPAPAPTRTPTGIPTLTPTIVPTIPNAVRFTADVAPILSRCQPCHFPGGKVYERLPFDRPETVRTLGTKLFSRIKDPDQQQVIRDFLAQAH